MEKKEEPEVNIDPLNYDEASILYAKYIKAIVAIGKLPFDKDLTIEDTEMNKAEIASCYKDIKKQNFKCGLVCFLCWISTDYLLTRWKRAMKEYDVVNMDKSEDIYSGLEMAITLFMHAVKIEPQTTVNLIRYVDKKPGHIYRTEAFTECFAKTLTLEDFANKYPNIKQEDAKFILEQTIRYSIHKAISLIKFWTPLITDKSNSILELTRILDVYKENKVIIPRDGKMSNMCLSPF
jgi:hypothetical protein